jgi:hypothetical protein
VPAPQGAINYSVCTPALNSIIRKHPTVSYPPLGQDLGIQQLRRPKHSMIEVVMPKEEEEEDLYRTARRLS